MSENAQDWQLLSKENSRLLSTLMRCEIGTCLVKLLNNEKYLLDTTERTLSNVRDGLAFALLFTVEPPSTYDRHARTTPPSSAPCSPWASASRW